MTTSDEEILSEADVLVIGGGPAGCWAALSATQAGAKVVLVDKGRVGTSGATAASGTQIWYVEPDAAAREAAMASREGLGGHLSDRRWMGRVLDRTYEAVNALADWGYPFPTDDEGRSRRVSVQGPEYMRLLRRRLRKAGVVILDQAPAFELLVDGDGVVRGAAGVFRQEGGRWRVAAGAVVLASGGCAFLSRALGCDVLTGDGYLMGAEAGAELSGMEFSSAYAIAPAFASVTKTAMYHHAQFLEADGTPIPGAGSQRGRSVIARALLTRPVFARIDADEETREAMRRAQPNFFLPFDRRGIDPFSQPFEVTLRLEGTVRGTGGLRIASDDCGTTVPGLYAAGDAATRELICGGFTGGGSHNSAWAISSGLMAGEGAAAFATSGARPGRRDIRAARARNRVSPVASPDVVAATQAEVMPIDRNYFRTEEGLVASLERLDAAWAEVGGADPGGDLRTREAEAMLATARFMYRAALARPESRGMHRRDDRPELDEALRTRLAVSGLDAVMVRPDRPGAAPLARAAA